MTRIQIRPTLIAAVAILVTLCDSRSPRSAEHLQSCIKMAEPLVYNPSFIFPTSLQEIRNVCLKWDDFVECVRSYATTFLPKAQQVDFDAAIRPSMQSIHQLCIEDPTYQKTYLSYAPCMKKISIDDRHCGIEYRSLAQMVEVAGEEGGLMMCCGHHRFRTCMENSGLRECNSNNHPGRQGEASVFLTSMLDRALGFLMQKCASFKPTPENCGGIKEPNRFDHNNNNLNHHTHTGFNNHNNQNNYNNYNHYDNHNPINPQNNNHNSNNQWNPNPQFNPVANQNNRNQGSSSRENPTLSGPSLNNPVNDPVDHRSRGQPANVQTSGENVFTWTTAAPTSFFPTRNYSSIDISVNNIDGPKSQEFKGSDANALFGNTVVSVASLALVMILGKLR